MGKGWVSLSYALVLGLGCTDDTSPSRVGDPGDPLETTIHADQGGTVSSPGVKAKIPKGALSQDETITVQVLSKAGLPHADMIASKVFDFGPDGTTFDRPVTLTIDFDASKTPDDKQAVMAFLDGDEWVALSDSMVDGDQVVATTTHFTPFAVIYSSSGAQGGGSCDDIEFSACGGDLIGTWEFTLGCVTLPDDVLKSNPQFATCDGLAINAQIDLGGTITFDEDGAYDLAQTVETHVTISYPKSCLTDMLCDSLAEDGVEIAEHDDSCDRIQDEASENATAGSYVVEGDTLITTKEGDEPGDPTEYCVDGDTITSKVITGDGQEMIFRATRK